MSLTSYRAAPPRATMLVLGVNLGPGEYQTRTPSNEFEGAVALTGDDNVNGFENRCACAGFKAWRRPTLPVLEQ
jgi:hypothetical protein